MGKVTSTAISLIASARSSYDDVRQAFRDHFLADPREGRVPPGSFSDGTVVVTANEVSDRHGTGVILSRCFGDSPQVLSIRTSNLYGEHRLGERALRFFHRGLTRAESYAKLATALKGNVLRRVVCVPYFPDELLTAIVLKDAFEARFCLYVMDDHCLARSGIPHALMAEAVAKADLLLAISPEMQEAYTQAFGRKFWLRPPVVTPRMARSSVPAPSSDGTAQKRGVLVGSVWSTQTLECLAEAVGGTDCHLDWFGNVNADWLKYDRDRLRTFGIHPRGFLPEGALASRLGEYAFAVVPSGSLDTRDDRPEITRFSLPTRMPFLVAAGNLPMIVLGHPNSAAARFVTRFGVGACAPYSPEMLRDSIEEICRPVVQEAMRARAREIGPRFSAEGVGRWILESTDRGHPVSTDLEEMFARHDTPVPDVPWAAAVRV